MDFYCVTVSTGKPNGAFLIEHGSFPYGKSTRLVFTYHHKERLSSNFMEEIDPD